MTSVRALVPPGRIVGIDVARCVALLGMMATHILVATDADGVTFSHQLAGGRASALFAVLAGVSIALMSGGTTPVRGRRRVAFSVSLVVRAVCIGLIGILLGELETSIAIILAYYAVLFVCALPFLGLRTRPLAVLAATWAVVVPVLSQLVRPSLAESPKQSPGVELLGDPVQLLAELTLTGVYPAVPWVAYLLAGMAVGRCDLLRRRTAVVLVLVGVAAAAAAKVGSALLLEQSGALPALLSSSGLGGDQTEALLTSLEGGLHGTTDTDTWWWLAVSAPHSTTPFDLAHTIGTALLVIGLSLLLGSVAPRVSTVVFGAGAMTLTLYSLHVVLRTPDFLDDDTFSTYVVHVAVVLAIGAAYRLARISGPLERGVAFVSGQAARVVPR